MEFLEVVEAASVFQAHHEAARAVAKRAPARWVYTGTGRQEAAANAGAVPDQGRPSATPSSVNGLSEEAPGWPLDEIDKEAMRTAPPALLALLRVVERVTRVRERATA